MAKIIEKRNFRPSLPNKKKVAAYCRVSIEKDAMLHSLANQVSYYQEYISANPDWMFVGIYADEGISGTKGDRPEFNRLIEDCKNHKIDLIITKSISRFARNTTLLLETTRLLKSLNIDVYFEEQNMHSLSSDGELMLTLLASFAEEEAKSMSNNVRWKVNKFFEEGKVWGIHDFYGYKVVDGNYEIKEDEALVIRLIFKLFTENGYGYQKIASYLNSINIPSPENAKWTFSTVRAIIQNITYTGELLLGKKSGPMNGPHDKPNDGSFPMYHVSESHPKIISKEIYEKANEKKANSKVKYVHEKSFVSPFDKKIKCASCNRNYVRKKNKYRAFWVCSSMSNKGATNCTQTLSLREDTLIELTNNALGIDKFDEALFNKEIERIIVHQSKDVDFVFKNGEVKTFHFEFKSRKESWTNEMKEKARKDSFKRWRK